MVSSDVGSMLVKTALADTVRVNGDVDILVNSAGITHTARLQDTSSKKYEVCRHMLCTCR